VSLALPAFFQIAGCWNDDAPAFVDWPCYYRTARLLVLTSQYQTKGSYSIGVLIAARALLEAQSAKREMGVSEP
jgi:hypothetical protein